MNNDGLSGEEIFKQKRKWQIALRRYVLEQKPSPSYARYFGLPVKMFRDWISNQFNEGITWSNFSEKAQFEHIMPLVYFDFSDDQDLLLCWNFTNIRITKTNDPSAESVNLLGAKAYFADIFQQTGYAICKRMVEKIELVEKAQLKSNADATRFVISEMATLKELERFSDEDFERINTGMSLTDVIAENKLLARFGK